MADDLEIPTPPSKPPTLPTVILDAAFEIWAAFQTKFTGGYRPPKSRWNALMRGRLAEPEIGKPFEDAAIEGAIAASEVILAHREDPI